MIFDPAQPHVALDTIDAIAAVIASRRESGLTVCVNQDGLSHTLSADEQREREDRLREARLHASADAALSD